MLAAIFVLTVLVATYSLFHLYQRHTAKPKGPVSVISNIKPIDKSFRWDTTEPEKIRPFVNKKDFRPNMGIKNLAAQPEQWLLIEDTYREVTTKKRDITSSNVDKTIQINDSPRSQLAAREYYDSCINFFLMRYPQYFVKKGNQVYNKINDDYVPASSAGEDPMALYLALARTMEEDVVVFLKDDPNDHEMEYTLRSGITGFPSGFDPSDNHDKVISEIHDVVPQYKERLKLSMGRFFNRLQPSDLWVRFNWTIQTHNQHYNLRLNHGHEGESIEEIKFEDIDFENGCFLRCERQVLTRLPKSGANIMTVRTYLTPISKIKQEGLADELCRAIDALPTDLGFYKRRPAWGTAVKQYLNL
ncbi:hypothetical protein PSN45_004265 [Yamadazyma tenuis]|uniref:HRQ family protein 2 n=1 Tax=Candida tenuis (strain ATCC 10573 / BCRC 21748 / CBS 615 / JCM 9827 / NBRC 10315 / NRRL Y-1498 / VKM Y-70) TaxID=590646 RepID=G3B6F0_CANTC|nr:uncharacterized protein CANTEDRAFT_106598 [Yamadazyma tenuis ATCC 10573]EGV63451.1 hypothetical protein CANTEDRAFT_106598 [Yamadazyma tenuis ATCC 10573]WEJ96722.1 hypothetical protein PSN45_004265 [Yamadazyma tenuis]